MSDYFADRGGIEGKRALILGGGGGLGKACTDDLARAGARVAVCDKDEGLLRQTVGALKADGIDIAAKVVDVRDEEALEAFLQEVSTGFGSGLDVLVNVVGGTFRQSFAESSPKGWDALIRANFTWLLHAARLTIPLLRAGGGGSIVNLTSIEAHRAAPGFAVYAAMKAAVRSLTETLAVELAPEGIRVNAIAADQTPTQGTPNLSEGSADAVAMRAGIAIPMGRYGNHEDVGGCALFLASDLSRYVTGSTLHPDGGTHASSGWLNWPGTGFSHTPPPQVIEFMLPDDEMRREA
jgi:3-oxoacyl-[acyl-carrier protein] reductase